MTKIIDKEIDGKVVKWCPEHEAIAHRITHLPQKTSAAAETTPKNPPAKPKAVAKAVVAETAPVETEAAAPPAP